MILRNEKYLDFSNPDEFDNKIQNLIQQIDLIRKKIEKEQQTRERKSSTASNLLAETHSTSGYVSEIDDVKRWTNENVKDWLKKNNIEQFNDILKHYDGEALEGLWEMKCKDYSSFVKLINDEIEKKNLQIQPHQKFKFFKKIDSLFQNNT